MKWEFFLFVPVLLHGAEGLAYGQIDIASKFAAYVPPVSSTWILPDALDTNAAAAPTQPWFGKRTAIDLWRVVSAPSRWDGSDWTVAGLCVAGTIGTAVYLDQYFQSESQEERNTSKDRWSGAWGQLGTIYSVAILGGAGVVGWMTDDPRGQQIFVDGLEASIIASGIITPIIKIATGRARPNQAAQDSDTFDPFSGQASFPSGHTTQAFTVATVVACTLNDAPWIGGIAYVIASGVGLSRINDDEHYLSDVVAGAIIGTFVGYEVVQANRERRNFMPSGMRITPIIHGDGEGIELSWRW